jgi:glycine dehydrogenase
MPMNLNPIDDFAPRHIGPSPDETKVMLAEVGAASLDALIDEVIPASIRLEKPLDLPAAESESTYLSRLKRIAAGNKVFRSFIGLGYHDTLTPSVIRRCLFENPSWYTPYTPYQAEIAQGRLESLLNFQTMVTDLTGMEVANASLLDEGTAAGEAMTLLHRVQAKKMGDDGGIMLVSDRCFAHTIEVLKSRAEPLGIELRVQPVADMTFDARTFGVLLQYPDEAGRLDDLRGFVTRAHEGGALVAVATDLLSLVLVTPPGEMGADVVFGNSQRFGVPLGFGGPHAAFFAVKEDYVRHMPGRIIGVSVDAQGKSAYRMALQTREQHIRREKATSNICTAQALLANMAAMYAVYHGPSGLKAIATRVHDLTRTLDVALRRLGYRQHNDAFFDTLRVSVDAGVAAGLRAKAEEAGLNFRYTDGAVTIALDETVTPADLDRMAGVFAAAAGKPALEKIDTLADGARDVIPSALARTSAFLTHPVFNAHRSETEMMRYMKTLERKDIGLDTSMIPLGSCTMKLNAASEMYPVSWPEFSRMHPFAPADQTAGYAEICRELEAALCTITGFAAVSLQPNSGAQGEFAGLAVIRAHHHAQGQSHRDVVLIPASAHGTNPASAIMAGYRVIVVATDARGNVDVADLRAKAEQHRDQLAALMITYPSTHGVFEDAIREICGIVHDCGGQVYMDGANMNAQVGLCRPGDIGADVCHLNLHKTFCIPHGGGGPGMGPIGVVRHLAPFLPGHPIVDLDHDQACGTISAAAWGSASILPISWAYIALMGYDGLAEATKIAILNANYIARRLEPHYQVLYTGPQGLVAHECIIDTRPFKATAGVDVEDIAKRIIDYGFHPPTVSFPVAGTLMIEPTESESKEELDRFCDAMIAIREEIREIEEGRADREQNLLTNAPHTLEQVIADGWNRPYPRERAAYPSRAVREHKVWPTVGRIDSAFGDRNLVCVCPAVEEYA